MVDLKICKTSTSKNENSVTKMKKEKTYTVLWGMCTATYYVVKAQDEDEAIERSGLDYDPDEDWAIESYEKDYVSENCHYAEVTCEDEEEEDDD